MYQGLGTWVRAKRPDSAQQNDGKSNRLQAVETRRLK